MALINALNNGVHRDEVSLFMEMINYFRNNYASVVVEKTHGHRVNFDAIDPYAHWGNVIKEISDVCFIVFSRKKGIARMTHLQAKWRSELFDSHSAARFKFVLNNGQYHMLSNRLRVHGSKIYPEDTLSYPLYSDSVASYGVFYPNANNQIEMAFELASMLSNANDNLLDTPKKDHEFQFASLETNYGYVNKNLAMLTQRVPEWIKDRICRFYCVHRYASFYELLTTLSTQSFEDELLNLHVGTRLDINPDHLAHLCSVLSAKGNNNDATMQSFQNFTDWTMEHNRPYYDEMREIISYLTDGNVPMIHDVPQIPENGDNVILLIDAEGKERRND